MRVLRKFFSALDNNFGYDRCATMVSSARGVDGNLRHAVSGTHSIIYLIVYMKYIARIYNKLSTFRLESLMSTTFC